MKTIIERPKTAERTPFTKEEIDMLNEATENVCMYCPRPPAWDGGEEECDRCMVSELCHMLWIDWHTLKED